MYVCIFVCECMLWFQCENHFICMYQRMSECVRLHCKGNDHTVPPPPYPTPYPFPHTPLLGGSFVQCGLRNRRRLLPHRGYPSSWDIWPAGPAVCSHNSADWQSGQDEVHHRVSHLHQLSHQHQLGCPSSPCHHQLSLACYPYFLPTMIIVQ